MREPSFLLFGVALQLACASSGEPRASATPGPSVGTPAPSVPQGHATRCAATPSTVYGLEPVVFAIEGETPAGSSLSYQLCDEHVQVVAQGPSALPAQVRLDGIPSGDFTLTLGSGGVTCSVTVNRELSRASQGGSQSKN